MPDPARPAPSEGPVTVRVDQWLWAVRIFPSRSAAAEACRAGHVAVNGRTAKPSSAVRVADRVEARRDQRVRVLEVTRVIPSRVGAPIAVTCYLDHSPPPDTVSPAFRRDPGTGRPTKRDRRQLDRLRGRPG